MVNITLRDNNDVKSFDITLSPGSTYQIDWVRGLIDYGDGLGFRTPTTNASLVSLGGRATVLYIDVDQDIDVYLETETSDKLFRSAEEDEHFWYDLSEYTNKIVILKYAGVYGDPDCGVHVFASTQKLF